MPTLDTCLVYKQLLLSQTTNLASHIFIYL